MSQPPSMPTPYEPPQFAGYRTAPVPPDLLAPARRAAVLMFILGGLGLACGTLFGAAVSRAPDEMFLKSGMKLPDTTGTPWTPIQFLRATIVGVGVLFIIVGIVYIIMGYLVRRGNKPAAIIGIVMSGLTIGFLLLNAVSAFVARGGDATAGVCTIAFVGVFVPIQVMLIKWLGQTVSVAKNLAAYRQQWALQQMYHYQQQQTHQQPSTAAAPAQPGTIPDYTLPPPHRKVKSRQAERALAAFRIRDMDSAIRECRIRTRGKFFAAIAGRCAGYEHYEILEQTPIPGESPL